MKYDIYISGINISEESEDRTVRGVLGVGAVLHSGPDPQSALAHPKVEETHIVWVKRVTQEGDFLRLTIDEHVDAYVSVFDFTVA